MARKSKTDWLEAGIQVLATESVDALTVDRVASRLGVTKGSFYAHFENFADYRDALLSFWYEEGTENIIATAESAGEALASMDRVMQLSPIVARRDDPELAFRAWAARDPYVRAFVQRVDRRRLKYGEDLFTVAVGDRERAKFLIGMLYALILGSGQMLPPVRHKGMLDYYEEFKRLLVPEGVPSVPTGDE